MSKEVLWKNDNIAWQKEGKTTAEVERAGLMAIPKKNLAPKTRQRKSIL